MNNSDKKCIRCGKELKPSQFAHVKREGESASKEDEILACRNYPNCPKSEKDIPLKQ